MLQPCLEHGDPSGSSAGLVGLGWEEVCTSGSWGCSVLEKGAAALFLLGCVTWEGESHQAFF